MDDYASLLATESDRGRIAKWLFENTRRMKEAIFLDPDVDWHQLEPIDILILRACSPQGVFSTTAKGGYLTQVGKNADLLAIADAIFANDYEFVTNLPSEWVEVQPQITQLMQLAYRKKIRPADNRVKSM